MTEGKKPRKQQVRTARTHHLLLQGAERVFARGGYERARLEEIAAAAGFSKGALFAHFKSKEELFLALYESKNAEFEAALIRAMSGAVSREEKIAAFRHFYIDLHLQKAWALIVLEMKLYILRCPDTKARLSQIDERNGNRLLAILIDLFGQKAEAAGEALGGIYSALVLEAHLDPDLVNEVEIQHLLGAVFDALLLSPDRP